MNSIKPNAVDILLRSPVIPVMVIDHIEVALPLAGAIIEGGIQVLEITLRTPSALAAIKKIKEAYPEAYVGAGTVVRADQFAQVINADADFIITPGITPALLDAAHTVTIPTIPGVTTLSEVLLAQQHGFNTLKFFPAEANGGQKALTAFAGPCAEVRFCPTGGINEKNYCDYLTLPNVMSVGGTWFLSKNHIASGKFDKISESVQTTLAHYRQMAEKKPA